MKQLTKRDLTRAQLRGASIVPMLTPANTDGTLDAVAIPRIVEHIIAGGSEGLMVCGTTGEFASLSVEDRIRVLQAAIGAARGRAMIFAGIGDTSPTHSIRIARAALMAGADAVVANLPSYYPLTDTMMEAYFSRLADAIDGPCYLYNIPQTTKQSIPLGVVERLSRHPRIAGIKDSEPDGERQEKLAAMFRDRTDFAVFCGSIAFTSRAMRAGADGFVPGAGNFAPAEASAVMDALLGGDPAAGDAAQQRIDAINATYQKGRTISQLFGALKATMEIHGLCGRHMFPPLLPATDADVDQIRAELRKLGIPR